MRLVAHFADIVEPLRNLQCNDEDWNWSCDFQAAFDAIIRNISSSSALAHLDANADIIVTMDSLVVAVRACLAVAADGENHMSLSLPTSQVICRCMESVG